MVELSSLGLYRRHTASDLNFARILKAGIFCAAALPGAILAHAFFTHALATPFRAVIQETGLWSMRLLVLGLLIAPLCALTGWAWPLAIRRMIGLFAAFYAGVHLLAWMRQYGFDWAFLGTEIALRTWLTIGTVGIVCLVPLVVTSNAAAHRVLSPAAWTRIHKLAYVATLAALVHYAMARGMTRLEVIADSMLVTAAFIWRLARRSA